MGLFRNLRMGAVAGVFAWKLTALALLPAALCCQAAMDPAAPLACCEGEDHGAMCPMDKSPNRTADPSEESEPGRPGPARMMGCNTLDEELIGLAGQTGFTPDAYALATETAVIGRVAPTHDTAASLAGAPHALPPRA